MKENEADRNERGTVAAERSDARDIFKQIEEDAAALVTAGKTRPLFEGDGWSEERRGTRNPWAPVRRRTRLLWLNLLSPFSGFAVTYVASEMLAALAARTVPSLGWVPAGGRWLAFMWLATGLIGLALRVLRGGGSRRGGALGRDFTRDLLRIAGRRGYYAWRLAAPALLLLLAAVVVPAGYGIFMLAQGIWNSMPTSPPPPVAPVEDGKLFGGDPTLGQAMRSMIRTIRSIMLIAGVLAFLVGALNLITERPAAKHFLSGMMCFGFGALANFLSSSDLNTGVSGADAFDR